MRTGSQHGDDVEMTDRDDDFARAMHTLLGDATGFQDAGRARTLCREIWNLIVFYYPHGRRAPWWDDFKHLYEAYAGRYIERYQSLMMFFLHNVFADRITRRLAPRPAPAPPPDVREQRTLSPHGSQRRAIVPARAQVTMSPAGFEPGDYVAGGEDPQAYLDAVERAEAAAAAAAPTTLAPSPPAAPTPAPAQARPQPMAVRAPA